MKTKIIIVSLMFLIIISMASATTYYVSNSGNDSLSGTSEANAIKTIAKVNTLSLNIGDSVLFNSGDRWFSYSDAYLNVTSGVRYSNYGIGDKPLIIGGSLYNGNWSSIGVNLWITNNTYPIEVGYLGFDNDSLIGFARKDFNLTENGDFWYNSSNDKVYLYLNVTPTNYSEIVFGMDTNIVDVFDVENITFSNLDFRNGARHGLELNNGNYINITNCTFKNIGGGYQTSTLRYGNCIQVWYQGHDILIYNNNLSGCYDAAITPQYVGDSLNPNFTRIFMVNNTIDYVRYCYEFFNQNITSVTDTVVFDHNTCAHIGEHWGTIQRRRLGSSPFEYGYEGGAQRGGIKGFNITNNIFYLKNDLSGFLASNPVFSDHMPNLTLNYNLYYDDNGTSLFATWDGVTYYYNQFSLFKSNESQDNNSLQADPLFVSGSYQPSSGSPACNMSSTGSYVGALPCAIAPKTYYVSTSGNNSNDGLSNTSPLKTLYNASLRLVNGDTLLLNGGDTFTGTDYIFISEKSDINVSSYGDGIPTIDGRRNLTMTASSWINVSNFIWRYNSTITTDYGKWWFGDVEYPYAVSNTSVNSTNRWFYDGTNDLFYVYSVNNPFTDYDSIRFRGVANNIWVNSSRNIRITNINLSGNYDGIRFTDVNDSVIFNNTIGYGCRYGVFFISNSDSNFSVKNNSVYGNIFSSEEVNNSVPEECNVCIADGISIRGGSSYNNIYNNNFTNWGHVAIYLEGNTNFGSYASTSYNRVYNNIITSPDRSYGKGIGIEGQSWGAFYNEIFENNISFVTTGIQANGNNNSFYKNIISDIHKGWASYDGSNGIRLERDGGNDSNGNLLVTFNNSITNNTIVNTDEVCILLKVRNVSYNYFANNLMVNCSISPMYGSRIPNIAILNFNNVQSNHNTFLNNVFYTTGLNSSSFIANYWGINRTVSQFNGLSNAFGSGDVMANNSYIAFNFSGFAPICGAGIETAGINGGLAGALPCVNGLIISNPVFSVFGSFTIYNKDFYLY